MIRVLFEYLIPFLLPSGVFVVYVMLTRKRGGEELEQRLRDGPWFWLIVGGFILAAAALFLSGLREGGEPSGTYRPPHLEDGRVVPGGFE